VAVHGAVIATSTVFAAAVAESVATDVRAPILGLSVDTKNEERKQTAHREERADCENGEQDRVFVRVHGTSLTIFGLRGGGGVLDAPATGNVLQC